MSPPPPRGTQKLLKNISNEISSKNAQIFTKPTEHVLKGPFTYLGNFRVN